jgi:hypothetical protein
MDKLITLFLDQTASVETTIQSHTFENASPCFATSCASNNLLESLLHVTILACKNIHFSSYLTSTI